jgi:hypothetical protein
MTVAALILGGVTFVVVFVLALAALDWLLPKVSV